jgi:hypothetical protein
VENKSAFLHVIHKSGISCKLSTILTQAKPILGQEAIKPKANGGNLVTVFCHLKHFLNIEWKIKLKMHHLVTKLPLLIFLRHF